jgi:PAS domain S-box-containing protein
MKISSGFLYLTVAFLTAAIISSTLFSISQMRSEALRQASLMEESHIKTFWELLRAKGKDFRVVDGKLLAGDYIINGNYELPDKVKEVFGGTATIFMGSVRVSTNVLKDDGSRAVGTLLEGPPYNAVFGKGESYRGEALILGVPYFTAYDPIRNGNGEVIGALYVGVKKSDFFSTYDQLRVNQILMAVVLILFFAVLIFLLVRMRGKAESALLESEQRLRSILYGSPIPQFVIDENHRVLYWNEALEKCTGLRSEGIVGTTDHWKAFYAASHPCLVDLLVDGNVGKLDEWYPGKHSRSRLLEGAYEVTDFFPALGEGGRWLYVTATLVRNSINEVIGAVETLEDITARKDAEEALRQSEERFRSMTASAMSGIVMIDHMGRITFWNDAAERIFGWSASEALGKDVHELIAPHCYLEMSEAAFPRFRETGSGAVIGKNLELVALRRDGEEFPVDLALSSLRLQDHWHAIGIINDISDRKQAEDELQEQLHFLQELIDAIPNPIFFKNTSYMYLGCNKAFERLLGMNTREIMGKTTYDIFPGELADIYHASDTELLKSGGVQAYESSVQAASGAMQDVIFNKAVFTKKDGAPGGIVGIILDISERKRMENALRESEDRFRRTFDQSPIGAAILSLDYRFLRVNAEWCRVTGYSERELLALRLSDISYPEDLENDIRMKTRLIAGEIDTFQMDKRYVRKDGRTIWARLSVCLMKDGSGQPLYFLPMMEDVTERKKLEEEVLKSRKLESLGVLAGGIAHDFNNLLTGILGNISLAKMYSEPENKIFGRLDEAEKATERARDLTYQLLTFSKGGTPIKKVCSIRQIVMDSAAFALTGSNVRCAYAIPDDIHAVEVDGGQISQVIHNLIINAVQAMPEGGIIRVSAENVTDCPGGMLSKGRWVRISIEDKGAGIPEDHLERIFDPYFTTKPKGSGLGLATVYSIIRNHSGYIDVESRLGEGATFSLYLPASETSNPSEEIRDPAIVSGNGRVLVMDDEEIVREVAAELLSALGYSVTVCCDGEQMLDLYSTAKEQGEAFDVVIMDLTIPGAMGGKEAMDLLLEIDQNARGIVSSGYNIDPILAAYRDYGFSGVVAKPFTVKELAEVLQAVLRPR